MNRRELLDRASATAAARRLLQAIGAEESEYAFFGGYEGAERRQLHFLPDWAFGPEEDAVAALRCRLR